MVFNTNIITVTSSTTLSPKDDVIIVNATTANITITLPNILGNGMQYKFKRRDSNTAFTVTIQGFTGAQTIDGLTSITLIVSGSCEVQSIDSVWYRLSNASSGSGGIPQFTTAYVQNNGIAYIKFTGTSGATVFTSFYYGGSNITPISLIIFTLARDGADNPTGTIGIYTQAGLVVGEIAIPILTLAASAVTISSISNVPTSGSVLEARINVTSSGSTRGIQISSLTIY